MSKKRKDQGHRGAQEEALRRFWFRVVCALQDGSHPDMAAGKMGRAESPSTAPPPGQNLRKGDPLPRRGLLHDSSGT